MKSENKMNYMQKWRGIKPLKKQNSEIKNFSEKAEYESNPIIETDAMGRNIWWLDQETNS